MNIQKKIYLSSLHFLRKIFEDLFKRDSFLKTKNQDINNSHIIRLLTFLFWKRGLRSHLKPGSSERR